MTFDLPQISRSLGLTGSVMKIAYETTSRIADQTRHLVLEAKPDAERLDLAVLHVLARAAMGGDSQLDPEILSSVVEWGQTRFQGMVLSTALAELNSGFLEDLLQQVLASHPQALAMVVGSAEFLPTERKDRMFERIASDRREAVREHFFALLGRHQRLMPPGSIASPGITAEALERILRGGIADRAAKVRERAIAAAYGLGFVDRVREPLFLRLDDEDLDVRQYAIVSLGVMQDEKSRIALIERLEHGSREEATSAIWALARRADGIGRALETASDPRPWVQDEILGAFGEVSAPMTDEQIELLRGRLKSIDFDRFRERHIARTRHGVAERGPDGQIAYVPRDPNRASQ